MVGPFGFKASGAGDRTAPPSTSEAVPVTKDESSDARYSTERASSSGFATRLSACRPVMNACDSGVLFMPRYMSVSTAPGRTALTRTPCGPNSAASACVRPIEARLACRIGGHARKGKRVADEGRREDHRAAAVLQHLRDLVLGAEERARQVDGERVDQPSSETPVLAPASPSVPALLKAMSSRPKRSRRGPPAPWRSLSDAHVAGQRDGLAALCLDLGDQPIEFSGAARADHDLGAFSGEQQAVAWPIPELAPVTMATLPSSRLPMTHLLRTVE